MGDEVRTYLLRPALVICGLGLPFALVGLVGKMLDLAQQWLDNRRCHGELLDLRSENRDLKWKMQEMAPRPQSVGDPLSVHLPVDLFKMVRRP